MADAITFWLDNKQAAGTRLGQLGDQVLVNYREKYYIIVNGAATTRSGRSLRYSNSSLPLTWKKLLRGDAAPVLEPFAADYNESSMPLASKKTEPIKRKEDTAMPEPKKNVAEDQDWPKPPTKKSGQSSRKFAAKQAVQSTVTAECPYCANKHEIPVEKGRSGRPFFQTCVKCSNDFAVKFVQVTVYQAQVAGFR